MGAQVKGRAIFPVNAGKSEGDITDDDAGYDFTNHETKTADAFLSVSVNPTFVGNNLKYENSVSSSDAAGDDLVSSANFLEIRNTSRNSSISNDDASLIGNRILPKTTSLTTYCTNKDETLSFKVKVYDSAVSDSNTNRKYLYSTSDYPSTDEVGLDIDNYDYFILLNPQIVEAGNDSVRPHFAKITRITSFDEFGDGLEFTPRYPTTIPNNTKFEIFKGPAKTDTSVVAVSYGLRGDTDANTLKYDRVNTCSLPTWYFYNDRLDTDNQLDYMTKYNLTHLRWWNYSTDISITEVDTHAQWEEGSGSVEFTTSGTDHTKKLSLGMSIFNSSNVFLGNIKTIQLLSNKFYLDYARIAITGTTNDFDVKIGKTIQNIVFRTEQKFDNKIQNKGSQRLEAVLVDANYTADSSGATSFFKWDSALPKMQRHTGNLLTATNNTLDGNLTGANKYLTFELANFKNNKIPMPQNAVLNNPRNKMSQLLSLKVLDNSGLNHMKIQEDNKLVVQNHIYTNSMSRIAFEGTVSRSDSNTSTIILSDIRQETELRHILHTDDIIEIDGYYYVVNVVSAQSSGTQSFTIKDSKTISATTWSGSAVAQNFDNKTMYLMPYTGVLNIGLTPDTEVDYTTNRMSINGATVKKENTKLYDARLVFGKYNTHVNKIEYGEKDNKFLKLQDVDRVFYQRSNESVSRFYYYTGGYSISDTVFNGTVEDVNSVAEQGMTYYNLTGRDDSSKLLSKTITKNNLFVNDIWYSSITPTLSNAETITNFTNLSVTTGSTSITLTPGSGNISIYPISGGYLLNQAGEFLGIVTFYNITNTITLKDGAYATPTATTGLKYFHPHLSTSSTAATQPDSAAYWFSYITGTKALGANELHTTGLGGLNSISEKVLTFDSGLGMTTTDNSTFTFDTLRGTSNTGTYLQDKSLGYDVSSPKSISTGDSTFAFHVGNENGVTNTKNKISSISSEMVNIVQINEKSEGETSIFVAPNFPMVLGRINSNTSDTRGNCNVYMINNNIPTGGFLHRLQKTFSGSGYYGPSDTLRYWDLQSFDAGTLTKNNDTIYWEGKQPQKIQGYCVGYAINIDGSLRTGGNAIANTNTVKPLAGSNTMKGWSYTNPDDSNQNYDYKTFYGDFPLIESYLYEEGSTELDIAWDVFEQIDPRADHYELLALGDAMPDSHLRPTNLGYHNKEFSEFGMMLETESSVSGDTTHQEYVGKTQQTYQTENMFEPATIKSSTKTTNQMRRWGIVRLVEATFDWHFNPVDFETLKPSHEINPVRNFDYVMFDSPTSASGAIAADSDLGAHTYDSTPVTGEYSVTSTLGDVFYHTTSIGQQATIPRLPLPPTSNNGFIGGHYSNGFFVNDVFETSGDSTYSSNLIRFDGSGYFPAITRFRLHSTVDYTIENLSMRDSVAGFRANVFKGEDLIRWTDAFILKPNINDTNLHYARLKDNDDDSTFEPHNIILPLISEERSGATNRNDKTFSMYHVPNSWAEAQGATSGNYTMLHMSRVIAGLQDRNYSGTTFGSNTSAINMLNKFGTGIASNSSATVAHIYDNCVGVFKDLKPAGSNPDKESKTIGITSTLLELDTDANYAAYVSNATTENDHDQHSRNLMIQKYGNNYLAMCGTKSKNVNFLDWSPNIDSTRYDDHNSNDGTTTGLSYSGQFIVKPRFDLTHGQYGVSVSSNVITFTLNNTTKHAWLSYMPNLEGYYLVSEGNTNSNSLGDAKYYGLPTAMYKITKHVIYQKPTTNQVEKHQITLDANPTAGMYRLMRFSEVTFDETPETVEFNVMKSNGLQYNTVSQDFRTGSEDLQNPYRKESVYYMHLLLDIDNADTSIIRTTGTKAIASFTNEEVIDMFFTDGRNKHRKKVTVRTKRIKGFAEGSALTKSDSEYSSRVENCLTFTFDGSLTGYGVVSCSEVFEMTLSKRPKLKNLKYAHIGTTFSIGSQITKEIENMIKDAGLNFDFSDSYATPTGNIVSNGATSATTLTCSANVEGLANGDVIYSSGGHLIGEVSNISNAIITVTKKYYTPSQYDEIVLFNERTFGTNVKFDDVNLFQAVNSLAIKQGLEYNIKNGSFYARNIEDTSSKRVYPLSYKESNRLVKVESNDSLFDKANKVIVIGDGIKYELQEPVSGDVKEVRIVDPSIKNKTDAEVKAVETLKIYSEDVKKIKVEVQKEGLELLEAGDIVRMNFPNHNIPKADYTVFEIENVLAGTMTITVGTFSKGIAERLSETSMELGDSSTTQFKSDGESVEAGKFFDDKIRLKVNSVSYEIVGGSNALSYNSNMGFDDIVGFTEQVGFEHSTVTKKSYGNKFYEVEDY